MMTGFKRVYLDTSPLIYYLQESEIYYGKMKGLFERFAIAETEQSLQT